MKNLIGAKLISLDETTIVVEKEGVKYNIDICNDCGGCCGYNEIEAKLLIEEGKEPVIINYTIENDDDSCGSTCKLALFGESKEIAEIETYSSSGSGWCYGATVWIECDDLDIFETLSEW